MRQGKFVEDYILKCNKDIDLFCEMYQEQINKMNVAELEIVAFHVTSNKDDCASIGKNGIRNLQWVLNNETEMRTLLLENGISFNVAQKQMNVCGQEYSIDYEKYKASLKDFAYFTFYRNEKDCEEDKINNCEYIKKQLILLAIQGMNGMENFQMMCSHI